MATSIMRRERQVDSRSRVSWRNNTMTQGRAGKDG
eukprot:CAMPEP_0174364812 /NCGR_PEP_ID=MMETSP0811_2-20130205/74485_1 /TAXON_ID=73025 ORGANISM="Eutreptiella gymnastica-like, Strain CCMP1594" /NCGR_SAMPLE_ID=MMETSP0811_2 /ASSEMBLY_ACC=CAM_ASM_000667 /LENGTH=34 /DNA_ID= /DNA_START= /DNA_END= /DNA_ORIENTATION=